MSPTAVLNFKSASARRCPALYLTGVYTITHRASGKLYVGSSSRGIGIIARLYEHRSKLNRGLHANRKLQKCFDAHGASSFDFAILETCPAHQAAEREQYYLDLLKPWENGFNVMRRVIDFRPRSQATRDAMAARSSKPYRLEFEGQIHAGNNLTAFCLERGLHQGAMTQVLRGKKPQFKGWTLPGAGRKPTAVRNHVTGETAEIPYFGGTPFAEAHGLIPCSFNKMLRGGSAVYRGWSLSTSVITPQQLAASFMDKAERARVNGRMSAVTLKGKPRRRRMDLCPRPPEP